MAVVDFYDGLAADYHLVYGDGWEAAVDGQGAALDRLIRSLRGGSAGEGPRLLVRHRHAGDRPRAQRPPRQRHRCQRAVGRAGTVRGRAARRGRVLHTVRFLVLTERATGWTVDDHSVRLRAVTRAALAGLAREAGFDDVVWHAAGEVGYHQPVMTARAS
jgi:hypothetical protein